MQWQLKPFIPLKQPRAVDRPDLPGDLVAFYAKHDVNPQFNSTYIVLHPLQEVVRVGLHDIGFQVDLLPDAVQLEWSKFGGIVVAHDTFGEEIVYVTCAPSCEPGCIMVLGSDVSGPGGVGPHAWDFTLVLARSFSTWLAHLERWQGIEYGVIPGSIKDLPAANQQGLRQYYRSLNPKTPWAGTDC
jgi:hypothetical protein